MSGRKPINVHSFGSLYLFNKARKPKEAGAASKCLECPYESECVWSAKKIYLESDMDHVSQTSCGFRASLIQIQWMTKTVVDAEVLDIETVADALRTSPYGACVYEAGNDVVDHQTVTMEYEGGVTASIVMSACEWRQLFTGYRGGLTCFSLGSRMSARYQNRRHKRRADR